MKKETFEKAQELQTKIEDLSSAIIAVENNTKHPCTQAMALNFSFCFDDDFDSLKKHVLTYLKALKSKYEKQFEMLK